MTATIVIDRTTGYFQVGPFKGIKGQFQFGPGYPSGGEPALISELADGQFAKGSELLVFMGPESFDGGFFQYNRATEKFQAYTLGLLLNDVPAARAREYGSISVAAPAGQAIAATGVDEVVAAFDTDGASSINVTPDHTANTITVGPGGDTNGVYLITAQVTAQATTAGEILEWRLGFDGTPISTPFGRTVHTGAGESATVTLAMPIPSFTSPPHTVDLRVRTTINAAETVTIDSAVLSLHDIFFDSLPPAPSGNGEVPNGTDLTGLNADYIIVGR